MATPEYEPEEPSEAVGASIAPPRQKGRRQSFGNVRRELSEDELATPGVQKMLLDELDRLDAEVIETKTIRDQYHEESRKVAVYEEKHKSHTAIEIISSGTIAVGSVFLGLAYGVLDGWRPLLLISGAFLLAVGIYAKRIRL